MKSTTSEVAAESQDRIPGGRWFVRIETPQDRDLSEWNLIIDFSGYVDRPNRVSLPRYLHERQSELIAETTRRIDEYAELPCAGGETVDARLRVDQGTSFWRTSGPAQKCLVRNPDLGTYIKLLAIEQLVRRYRPSSLATDSEDPRIAAALRKIALSSGVAFTGGVRGRVRAVPGIVLRLQAMLRFAAIAMQALTLGGQLRHGTPDLRRNPTGRVLFVAYSDNLRLGADAPYETRYWKGLPELVEQTFQTVTWMHLYVSNLAESRRAFCRRLSALERRVGPPHRLLLLDQFLSLRLVVRAIVIFARLQWRLGSVQEAVAGHSGRGVDPWPFMAASWDRSMKGGTAAAQIVQKLLIDEFARVIGPQQVTVYLFEGMPWEQMFIDAWQRHGNGPLLAYQHATIKEYDLRPLSYLPARSSGMTTDLPVKILVNGPAAMRSLEAMGFDTATLIPVEATRFDHLGEPVERSRDAVVSEYRVLLILEGIEAADRFMLDLVVALGRAEVTGRPARFIIKAHPSGRVSIADTLSSKPVATRWTESHDSIRDALTSADIVCASVNSSSAIEAHMMGLPVVLLWKPDELIRSSMPLDDWSQIATDPPSLQRALARPMTQDTAREPVFFLGEDRSRWRAVLAGEPA